MRTRFPTLLPFVALVGLPALIAGCGNDDRPLELSQSSTVALVVTYDDGHGETRTAEIHCGKSGPAANGYKGRSAARLCRDVKRLTPFLTADQSGAVACLRVHGGPETARIEGDIEGERIDREFDRTNSCGVAKWRQIAPLLPAEPSS